MKRLRSLLFWAHLIAGLISGVSIGIMCFTGTALAFEKQLVAWSERDARVVAAPAPGAPRLTLDEMQARLRAAHPDARPMSIVLKNDPLAAVAFTAGRGAAGAYYVNPYTGDVRQPRSTGMSSFMRAMTDLHRVLGFTGETSRPRGKLINGVCNIAFFVLAVTGLYLWMPRAWSWRAVKPVVWFRQNATSRARDFNWHNTIGLWTAPILIVLTLTAIPISFRWGGALIYTLTGTPAPSGAGGPAGGAAGAGPAIEVAPPTPDAKPLSRDALLAAVQKQNPAWETLTLRTGNAGPGGRGERGAARATPSAERSGATPDRSAPSDRPAVSAAPAPQAVTFTLRESNAWPRTATTTLAVNPFTAETVRRTGYAEQNAAQQVRSWTRYLHTGEALGWLGQLVAGLACLGGVFLVYTGFALSWRRFFGKRTTAAATAAPEA